MYDIYRISQQKHSDWIIIITAYQNINNEKCMIIIAYHNKNTVINVWLLQHNITINVWLSYQKNAYQNDPFKRFWCVHFVPIWRIDFVCGTNTSHEGKTCSAPFLDQKVFCYYFRFGRVSFGTILGSTVFLWVLF